MKDPIVLSSNQNDATISDNGICPTLVASMGCGGVCSYDNNRHIFVAGFDCYNQMQTGNKTKTLRSGQDLDKLPVVFIKEKKWKH